MIIDIIMVVLLPMLMAYSLIGETFHEIAGTAMFVLFIVHHILNRGWYKTLFRGKYTARRIFQTIINMFLLVFMFLQPVSGILMSKHLYTFLDVPGISAMAREIHLVSAYWGFVLLSLHAGTHLTVPLGKLKWVGKRTWVITISVLTAISLYGIYAFIKRQLAGYMFLQTIFVFFDFNEPRIWFFLDYLTIMVLFAFIGYFVTSVLSAAEAKQRRKEEMR